MGWKPPTFEEQLFGMQAEQSHVAALASRWALRSTVVGPESTARRLAGTGFLGRSVLDVVRADLQAPANVVAQTTLLDRLVPTLEQFMNQPLRDPRLTTWEPVGEDKAIPHYRQRVVTRREVGTFALYREFLGEYQAALEAAAGDESHLNILLKHARNVAELVNPTAWALQPQEDDVMPVADGTIAYLDLVVQAAEQQHGPQTTWLPQDEPPSPAVPPQALSDAQPLKAMATAGAS